MRKSLKDFVDEAVEKAYGTTSRHALDGGRRENPSRREFLKYVGVFAVGAVVGYISRELAESYGLIPSSARTVTQTITERITETVTEITTETIIKSIKELFDAYLTEIGKLYPELCEELKKLPDFKGIDAKNVEVLDDVKYLANLNYNKIFRPMLEEGIPDKRKYCTPLEALIWILYDKEPGDPMITSLLEDPIGLTKYSWRNSSISNNYKSDRWKNFNEVVDRLNSPDLISIYMRDNITFEYDPPGENIMQDAQTTFNRKAGDCEDHAMFGLYCLIKNGFHFDNFKKYSTNAAAGLNVQWESSDPRGGHAVCLYMMNGLFYYLDNNGVKRGPFSTLESAVNDIAIRSQGNWVWYEFFDINWNFMQRVYKVK